MPSEGESLHQQRLGLAQVAVDLVSGQHVSGQVLRLSAAMVAQMVAQTWGSAVGVPVNGDVASPLLLRTTQREHARQEQKIQSHRDTSI